MTKAGVSIDDSLAAHVAMPPTVISVARILNIVPRNYFFFHENSVSHPLISP